MISILKIEKDELKNFTWSFLFFFLILFSYYIVRPIRSEMGILAGVDKLQWAFSGVFIAMLILSPVYSYLASCVNRRQLISYIYIFFAINLFIFFYLFKTFGVAPGIARSFFIWGSVYNLFITSLFWSLMADIWNKEQGKRIFGSIAVGGTLGAFLGPIFTSLSVEKFGTASLLLVSGLALLASVFCMFKIEKNNNSNKKKEKIGGNLLSGFSGILQSKYLLAIVGIFISMSICGNFLYNLQIEWVNNAIENSVDRTALFAKLDFFVSCLTILTQGFLFRIIIKKLGIEYAVSALPILIAISIIALAFTPSLILLLTLQVIRRVTRYGIASPATEVLFTVVSTEEKYKSKNIIDTVISRGGDAMAAWIYWYMISVLKVSHSFALITVLPVALTGVGFAYWVGKNINQKTTATKI